MINTTKISVGLIPTSHDCEDDECVDGSAISPATVYMCMFWGLIVFENEHQVVHVCIDLFQRSLQYRSVHMEPECS